MHVIVSEPEQGSFLLTLNSSSLGLLSSVQLPYTQSLLSSHPTLPAVLTSIPQSTEVIVIDTNGTRIAAYFLAAAPLSVLGAVIHPVSLSLYVLDANSGSVVVLSSDNELLGRLWLRSNATRLMALALSPSARFLFVLAVLDAANDTDSNQYVVEQIDVRSNETLRHWLWSVDDVTLGACIAPGLSDDEFYLLDFTVSRPLRVNVSSHELVTLGRHPILRGLTSVSVDSEGEVYVCQGGTPPQVSQLTAEGDLKAVYQGVGGCGYQQNVYAAVDASRRVYLTDCGGITVFNQSQAVVQTIRLPAGSAVRSIVVDSLLRLFYTDDSDGDAVFSLDARTGRPLTNYSTPLDFQSLWAVAVDERRGLLYAVEDANVVYCWHTNGSFVSMTSFSVAGGFQYLAVNSLSGSLLLSTLYAPSILYELSVDSGRVLGSWTSGDWSSGTGLAVDSKRGLLYVGDEGADGLLLFDLRNKTQSQALKEAATQPQR